MTAEHLIGVYRDPLNGVFTLIDGNGVQFTLEQLVRIVGETLRTQSQQKHNGMLDSYGEGTVSFENGVLAVQGMGDTQSQVIVYTPSQALSLLAFLNQEREALERLVKEQAI